MWARVFLFSKSAWALLWHRTNAKFFIFVLSFDNDKEGNDSIHCRPSRRASYVFLNDIDYPTLPPQVPISLSAPSRARKT